jgi:AraC family transcriptional regulator of arabinose operon
LLQSLQVELYTAQKTQVSASWGETDSIPPYNKLYFILNGKGWINVNGEDYYPQPGQLFLTPTNSQISFAATAGEPYLKYWCHFRLTAGPFDLFQWIGVPLLLDVSDPDRLTALFEELIACRARKSIAARLREKALLLDIVCLYLEQTPTSILQHRSDEINRLRTIQHFVETKLHTTITVERMAEELHLHPNYFISYFKKHFGLSPLKYVHRKRIERACQLLTSTSLSIKEIAALTGFAETSHFTKFFGKEMNLSPTEYRASYTKSDA